MNKEWKVREWRQINNNFLQVSVYIFSHSCLYNPVSSLNDSDKDWKFNILYFHFVTILYDNDPIFHISHLLQKLSNFRSVNIEFLGNFSCNWKRISFDDGSQLVVVNFWWLATMLLIFKAPVSSAKLLEPPLHWMFISSSWPNALLMLQVVSAALQPILNSKKIVQICFLTSFLFFFYHFYNIK